LNIHFLVVATSDIGSCNLLSSPSNESIGCYCK